MGEEGEGRAVLIRPLVGKHLKHNSLMIQNISFNRQKGFLLTKNNYNKTNWKYIVLIPSPWQTKINCNNSFTGLSVLIFNLEVISLHFIEIFINNLYTFWILLYCAFSPIKVHNNGKIKAF